MESDYYTVVIIIAAIVGAFIGYIIIDQIRYRKEKVRELLTEIGATEIEIKWIEHPFRILDKFPDDIYHVEYRDAHGLKHKAAFTFSNITSAVTWKDEP